VAECRPKANRTKKRVFNSCDAARIAREVVKDDPEVTPEQVLACIAKGMGFTHISLSRQRSVESSVSLRKSVILAILQTVKESLKRLGRKPKILAETVLFVIEGIDSVIDFIDSLDLFDPSSEEVDKVIQPGKCECAKRDGVDKGAPGGKPGA